MQLHTLTPDHHNKTAKRVGRGGRRGKTSGRGHKGQKSRAGHSIRPAVRDMLKKLPKLRGHGKNRAKTVNSGRVQPAVVNIGVIARLFESGADITPRALVGAGLVNRRGGRIPPVKILASGDVQQKLAISGCELSETARLKVESAGGSVE